MKKICYIKTVAVILILTFTACSDYLDIMPDNVATMENAFSDRNVTQKFLFSCYNMIPDPTSYRTNPALVGGDEIWWVLDSGNHFEISDAGLLTQGVQNASDPYLNYWDGARSGKQLFIGIRDCNIFLENIHIPTDMEDREKAQWTAEVKFIKAYLHYYLLRHYGPIPIIKENVPVHASAEEIQLYREPVDDVVNYIVELIDEALPDLMPNSLDTRVEDAGRITQPIAAALKAEALVWLASPLLNGSEEEAPTFSLIDKRGVQLFPQEYNNGKWTRAAQAIKEAIEICHTNGHGLYSSYDKVNPAQPISDITKQKCTLRGAVTEKYNPEIVWPATFATSVMEQFAIPYLDAFITVTVSEFGPTLKIAEQFYSRNGLPLDEDAEWVGWVGDNFIQRYEPISVSTVSGSGIDGVSSLSEDHRYYIKGGETTAKLHFYREPRFYAWIGFDRGFWEMNGKSEDRFLQSRATEISGTHGMGSHVTCGYHLKKLVNMESVQNASNSFTLMRYTYPLIRLSGLYLLYAEALNESKSVPDDEVYKWIDTVRIRAGVPTVLDAYTKAIASKRNKPATKAGMREIIKQERLIELSFESQRFYDLIRWKDAFQYWNEPVRGWNNQGSTIASFYQVTTYFDQRTFTMRDYFWPLKLSSLQSYSKLVQNPGW
jgi:hypothetical protein